MGGHGGWPPAGPYGTDPMGHGYGTGAPYDPSCPPPTQGGYLAEQNALALAHVGGLLDQRQGQSLGGDTGETGLTVARQRAQLVNLSAQHAASPRIVTLEITCTQSEAVTVGADFLPRLELRWGTGRRQLAAVVDLRTGVTVTLCCVSLAAEAVYNGTEGPARLDAAAAIAYGGKPCNAGDVTLTEPMVALTSTNTGAAVRVPPAATHVAYRTNAAPAATPTGTLVFRPNPGGVAAAQARVAELVPLAVPNGTTEVAITANATANFGLVWHFGGL